MTRPTLVFIHGWGFTPSVWDALAAQLPEFPQQRIDMGYWGERQDVAFVDSPQILVGHSLGLLRGLKLHHHWSGWVAINGFLNFVPDCVQMTVLREMRRRLVVDPLQTLERFYALIKADDFMLKALPHVERLKEDLDFLQETRIDRSDLKQRGLVLASEKDPLVPIKASLAFATRALIEWHKGAGHLLPWQDPMWCVSHIRHYLSDFE